MEKGRGGKGVWVKVGGGGGELRSGVQKQSSISKATEAGICTHQNV